MDIVNECTEGGGPEKKYSVGGRNLGNSNIETEWR